ncbi:MAG TPA: methyltransferase domain-containing protein [Streptosporangiaceae bacterium]|jgi:ubiquinone/menaquinone biosynthesis C-methylase UbiE
MSPMLEFDDATSRRIEATYATADIVAQRRTVRELLRLRPGEDVLDIGCGPGLLACEMAGEVGPAGSVHGVDASEPMLALAAARARPPGAAPLELQPADVTALPFGDGSFDAATSIQVYEYADDLPAALAEAHRVLRPGGRLLVLDTDWDSVVWHSSDRDRMRRVLAAWEEHLADPRLPRRLAGLLRGAGFTVACSRAIPVLNTGYDPATYSAWLAGTVGAFVLGRAGLTGADVTAWREDLAALGDDYFFSLNRYLFLATR